MSNKIKVVDTLEWRAEAHRKIVDKMNEPQNLAILKRLRNS